MTMDATTNTYHLLDACALLPAELELLQRGEHVAWIYGHVKDDTARFAGPVLACADKQVDAIVERLMADDASQWALTSLISHASFSDLVRHMSSLRYLRAPDGQKFYLRFADSRCLASLWQVLTERQRLRLLGPIATWRYTNRRGLNESLDVRLGEMQREFSHVGGDLRLNDQQFDELLHLSWPDQLLLAVGDQAPELLLQRPSWQRHAIAKRVCDWLRQTHETRYPVQLAMAKSMLKSSAPDWGDSTWLKRLGDAHEQSVTQHEATT